LGGAFSVVESIFNLRSGDLETICIGSRESPIFLRIYDKKEQATKDNDIVFWLDVWGGVQDDVTRVEWEVKPNNGNFEKYLSDFKHFDWYTGRELLIYLLDWGRLAEPSESDSTRSRWPDSEFWKGLREISLQWADGVDWPVTRFQHTVKPMSERYAKQLAGMIAGGMARTNPEDPNIEELYQKLKYYHVGMSVIENKAIAKSEILMRSE
jgi:hypothetical protein